MSAQIDYSDIQGLVRFAHSHLSEAAYLLVNVANPGAARAWLRQAELSDATKRKPIPTSALQIAVSAKGLAALEVAPSIINGFSDEFILGMADGSNRSRRLGDIGPNNPKNWGWGGLQSGTPDLLLIVFEQSPEQLETALNNIQSAEFTQAFELLKTLDSKANAGKEHFGFADGISQPKIDWQQQVSVDLHERDRYSNLLALGEVILGFPNEYGLYTDRPLVDPNKDNNASLLPVAEDQPQLRDLGKHGTYLVFRQLSQDVPAFWQFVDQHAESDPEQRQRLASTMMGRHADGTALVDLEADAIDGIELGSQNHFTYDKDPAGFACPVGSHVRRANPRTGDYPPGITGLISRIIRALGFKRKYPTEDLVASTRFHRILRRGRTYGNALSTDQALTSNASSEPRGLHFVCLGANISRQFEFVQNAWLVSSKFAGLSAERDPIVGIRETTASGRPTDQFTMPQQNGAADSVCGIPQFVTVQGGAYFFMPGIAALKYLCSETTGTDP